MNSNFSIWIYYYFFFHFKSSSAKELFDFFSKIFFSLWLERNVARNNYISFNICCLWSLGTLFSNLWRWNSSKNLFWRVKTILFINFIFTYLLIFFLKFNWKLPSGNSCSYRNRVQNCNTQPCPANPTWSSWGAWTTCTITCGGGIKSSMRSCINPDNIGTCSGNNSKIESCNIQPCSGLENDY